MKIFIVVLVCLAASLVIAKHECGGRFNKKCSNGTVTEDDVNAFLNGSDAPDTKLQKYFACVHEEKGVITKEGINIDSYKKCAQSKKDQDAANKLLENCKITAEKENGKDVQGGNLAKCLNRLKKLERAPPKEEKAV